MCSSDLNRDWIAFVSNFRKDFNEKINNVFVISVDGKYCYQVTPGVEASKIRKIADENATVSGSFRFGQGAIAAPIQGARVGYIGGTSLATTGAGGEFSLKVPAGNGKVVVHGTTNGTPVAGAAEYEVDANGTFNIGPIVGAAEVNSTPGPLHWAPSGTQLFAFSTDTLVRIDSVHMNLGETQVAFEREADAVSAFGLFPAEAMAFVAFKSAPTKFGIYDLTDQEESVRDFEWPDQLAESKIAVSPVMLLASLLGDKVVVFGADGAGELAWHDVTPANVAGLVQDQFDWSLDAAHIVMTMEGAAGSNLVVLNVNDKTFKALTTDGKSRMPAWFGR